MKRYYSILAAVWWAVAVSGASAAGDWRDEISKDSAGAFPPLPSVKMHFAFGWSNVLEAAEADVTIIRKDDKYSAKVTGRTEGLARTLWPLDAQHSATIQAATLMPNRIAQIEKYRNRTIETVVRFDAKGVDRLRKTSPSSETPKWKRINASLIRDVIGGVLYVRSQPLNVGDEIGVLSFPGDSPYLMKVRVEKRETIRCMGKDRPALKLSMDIQKIEVKKSTPTTAAAYSKFRSGSVWVSDDDLRLPLRAEVKIFVGFVYGELESYEKL